MPDFVDLQELSKQLSGAGIVHALGGSGLISYLGLPIAVNDWDITTDASIQDVESALQGMHFVKVEQEGAYKSAYLLKIKLNQSEADVIGRFAILDNEEIITIQTIVTDYWESVPIGSLKEWLKAYRAMGNLERVSMLEAYLKR